MGRLTLLKLLVPSPLFSTLLLILAFFSTYMVEMSNVMVVYCNKQQLQIGKNSFEQFTKKFKVGQFYPSKL